MKSIFVIGKMLEAISNGMFHASIMAKMDTLETRKAELKTKLAEVPVDATDGHVINLYGELAAILELSGFKNDEPRHFTGRVSVVLVAGGRNRRNLTSLKCLV